MSIEIHKPELVQRVTAHIQTDKSSGFGNSGHTQPVQVEAHPLR